MLRLLVRLVITDEITGDESILAKLESDQFDPEHFNLMVNDCLTKGLEASGSSTLNAMCILQPEISAVLTSDDEQSVRPSLHLNFNTIKRLAEAGAAFDFDPYV